MPKLLLFMMVFTLYSFQKGKAQCACCSGAGMGSAISYGDALLLKKTLTLETYVDFRSIHSSNIEMDGKEAEIPLRSFRIHSIGFRYGISHRVSIGILLPYTVLHSSVGNDHGVGDLITMLHWNVFKKKGYQVVLQGGLECPTGSQIQSQKQQTIVMTGSGSYDPMAGILLSKNVNRWVIQASALYKKSTIGFDDNNFGSVHTHNLMLAYNICENKKTCDTADCCSGKGKFNFNVSVGYYGEWLGQIQEDEKIDDNSGYYAGFTTLGINVSLSDWILPITFSHPVYQKMNGDQNHPGPRFRVGLVKKFKW